MPYSEKRIHPRYAMELPVVVTESGASTMDTRTVNLSLGGACLSSERPIIENKILHISLKWLGKNFTFKGRVAYCRRLDGLRHRIGVTFVQAPHAFRREIHKHLPQLQS